MLPISRAFFVFSLFGLSFILCFLYKGPWSTNESKITLEHRSTKLSLENNTKVILFWNDYYGEKTFGMGNGYEGFQQCPESNCYATSDHSTLMDPNIIVKAVAFHVPRLKLDDVKWLKSKKQEILQLNQGIDPTFIMFSMEPPEGSKVNGNVEDPMFRDFFDMTMSYKHDSDIYSPYGLFVDKTTGLPPMDWKAHLDGLTAERRVSLKERTKDIAWVVSHCESASKREEYAQKLIDLHQLQVDIFGKCGNQDFPKRQLVDEGYKLLAKNYKFYLSFENSNCKDYITEKLFFAMQYGLLPIALGGFSIEDYEKSIPPHSYLHVDHFENPEQLMDYLVKLSGDEELYSSYFWWKEYYDIKVFKDLSPAACKLCQLLNIENYKSPNDYDNVQQYWHQCKTQE